METKQIPVDCTLTRYRKEYASVQLYKQLRWCLVYQIIAVILLLVLSLLVYSSIPYMLYVVCGLLLIPTIVTVGTRSRLLAIAATVIAVPYLGYSLWNVCSWLKEDMWDLFWNFGFGVFLWVTKMEDTITSLIVLLSSGLSIRCYFGMLKTFRKIDAEYRELMANLKA